MLFIHLRIAITLFGASGLAPSPYRDTPLYGRLYYCLYCNMI